LRSDGTEFPVEVSVTRGDLAGRPFFTGYLRDLTERKRAEEERTSLEAQLRQAQKMEAIGRLAAGITHDFNNLLAVVRGFNELMLSKLEDGDPLRRHAEEIRQASDKAASLTQQLLFFTPQRTAESNVLDLNALIVGIESMLGRVIGEDVELVTRLDPDLGNVRADPGQLERVIMNLVVNARDAMPDGGTLSIETRAAETAESGRYAVLSVRDTGVGMDAETSAHIFEPFFTTKEAGKGTGLGLSTVYGIVNQSGGFISVESRPGQGTTFNVHLPVVDAPLDPPDADPGARGRSGTEPLIEEDEPTPTPAMPR